VFLPNKTRATVAGRPFVSPIAPCSPTRQQAKLLTPNVSSVSICVQKTALCGGFSYCEAHREGLAGYHTMRLFVCWVYYSSLPMGAASILHSFPWDLLK